MKAIIFILLLLSVACTSDQSHASDPLDEVAGDSLTVAAGDTALYATPVIERPTENLPDEMIGSWEAIELRIGDMIMTSEDLDEQGITPPQRYFNREGYMQLGKPSGEIPRIPISYFQGEIHSADQGKEQVIYLGADTLILSADVDGELSTYTYVKVD